MTQEEKNEKKQKRGEEERRRELIRELLKTTGISREAIFGTGGLMKELTKAVVEEALAGEMTHHLGYRKGEAPAEGGETRATGGVANG